MLIIQFNTLSLWKNASHTNFIHFCKMSLVEFQRYFIVNLVSKLVSLHKKRKKNGMKKNANHAISIYGNCMIRIKKKLWKKSFEQSIQLLANNLSVFWAATTENFDFFCFCFLKKNTSHTISIYGNCMTSIFFDGDDKNFSKYFWNWNFFVFFFNRKLIFVFKQTFFEKKSLHAKFNFLCV